jgi:hypothetical protein
MNEVSKALARSILRWTHLHHVKDAPLKLPRHYNELQNCLPKNFSLQSGAKLRAAVIYVLRTQGSQDANRLISESFTLLKDLNDLSFSLKELCQSRDYRNRDDVLSHAKIRIGQVIQHKVIGYRGICAGWTLDPSTNQQKLSVLLDW